MQLTREYLREIVRRYCDAWQMQDANAILSIFTEDALYHERIFEEPIRGHDGIRRYWISKVVESQSNIQVRVLNTFVDGSTGIAEWEVTFNDCSQGVRKLMKEVAILDFQDGKIQELREYWASKPIATSN